MKYVFTPVFEGVLVSLTDLLTRQFLLYAVSFSLYTVLLAPLYNHSRINSGFGLFTYTLSEFRYSTCCMQYGSGVFFVLLNILVCFRGTIRLSDLLTTMQSDSGQSYSF